MGHVMTRTRAAPCERFFPSSRWLALNSRAGNDAGGPIPSIRNRGEPHVPEFDDSARHGGPLTDPQREAMRDKTRTNGKPGTSGSNRKSGTAGRNTPESTSQQHTDAQWERMQTGLRILARMIARAHLRREASGAAPVPPTDQGNGEGAASENGGAASIDSAERSSPPHQ